MSAPGSPGPAAAPGLDAAVARAREVLELDRDGLPRTRESAAIVEAVDGLLAGGDEGAIAELLDEGFLRDAEARYAEHVGPLMRPVPAARFAMGTDPSRARHFCGETPRHEVELASFELAAVPVTGGLLGLLDSRRDLHAGARELPATNVTWFDAAVFAMWVGCRLPTEAEWERACGDGRDGEWCCEEPELPRFAWFSENSRGELRAAGTREPNALGLFDMHGSVWEWCLDVYDQDYYSRSPVIDPVNLPPRARGTDRVCRGGSLHSLAEMCRTRYRFHDPPELWAADLGFRLARDPGGGSR